MEPVVIKISGNVADEPEQLNHVLDWAGRNMDAGQPVVLVHGGGRQINRQCAQLGIPVQMVEGRRITDAHTLDVLTAVLAGTVNKGIVSMFRERGWKAAGITGIDGNLTTSNRRAPIQAGGAWVDFGLVGEMESVDTSVIMALLSAGIIPVVGCLTWSKGDGILNINADTFANRLAVALGSRLLVAVMDVVAVLDAQKNPLKTLDRQLFETGKTEGWIRDGMIPKLTTAFAALNAGVNEVLLTNAEGLVAGTGTRIIPIQ